MSDKQAPDSDKKAIEEAAKNRTMQIDLGDLADGNEVPAKPDGSGGRGEVNRTMRIDLTDVEPEAGEDQKAKAETVRAPQQARPPVTRQIPLQSIPITQGQWKPGQFSQLPHGAAQPKKETTKAVGVAKGTDRIVTGEPAAGKDVKRATAPVDLTAPHQVMPKTIRLKRPATTIVAVQPGSAPGAATPETIIKTVKLTRDTSKLAVEPSKKGTERIQLEGAGEPPTQGEKRSTKPVNVADTGAAVPKTILLKKPATVATVLRSGAADKKATDAIKKATDTILAATRKSQTTRIEIPAQDNQPASAPATQVKTVRLKRTAQAAAVDVSGAGAEAEAQGEFDPSQMIPEMRRRAKRNLEGEEYEGEMNVLFPILAVAALLVIGALTYILSAQAFGPELAVPVPSSWL